MASIVLTAVGTAVGGPVGGMIGNIVGRQLDQMVFGYPGRRVEGRRLEDLSVQLSSYGQDIPRLYGHGRVAGNIIWSTGLIETRHEDRQSTGGKGSGPKVTQVTYRYAASFAVALSSRPITDIGRIWADGKLLRDPDGNCVNAGDVRLYPGHRHQQIDPLIEAYEGTASAPAYRNTAYIVFEELDLADYANRIPNITVEYFADEGGKLRLSSLVEDVCLLSGIGAEKIDASALDVMVEGYSLRGGTSPRETLDLLAEAYGFDVIERGDRLVFRPISREASLLVAREDIVPQERDEGHGAIGYADPLDVRRIQSIELPEVMRLRYVAQSRNYQPALAQACHKDQQNSHSGQMRHYRVQAEDVALLLSETDAKRMAEARLSRLWQERTSIRFRLPPRYFGVEAGDVIRLEVKSGQLVDFRLEEVRHEKGGVTCVARQHVPAVWQQYGAASVLSVPQQQIFLPHPSAWQLFELPSIRDDDSDAFAYWAAGPSMPPSETQRWRGAVLYMSTDGAENFRPQLQMTTPAVLAELGATLPAGPVTHWDMSTVMIIDMLTAGVTLESHTPLAVLNGANALLVGEEIIQFATATRLSDSRYALSQLLRGRLGTEFAVGMHQSGDRVVLLDKDRIVPLTSTTIGREDLFKTVTTGQLLESVAALPFRSQGIAWRPYAPVHGRAVRSENNDLTFSWMRRSRISASWQDGHDVPLGEKTEAYDIEIVVDGQVIRHLNAEEQSVVYTQAAQMADFGALAQTFELRIYQISDRVGRGVPLIMYFNADI